MAQFIRKCQIRLATEADLRPLAALDRAVFEEHAYPFFVLRQFFDVHGERLLLVEQDGELLGYNMLASRPDGQLSWVLGLGVVPHARRRGHARRLMAEGIELLAADKIGEVRLSVAPDNEPALALYRSLGFGEVRTDPDYFGPADARLIMRLPLAG